VSSSAQRTRRQHVATRNPPDTLQGVPAKLTLLRAAERVTPTLRKIGLGGLLDRAASGMSSQLGQMTTEFEGFTIHTSQVGHVYYMRDLLEDEHDRYFRKLLVEAIPEGGTVLEGGAHLGVMTLFAARAAGSGGRVFTFEPNAETLPILQQNVDANGFTDRVTVVPLGLSAEEATHTFYVSGGGETSSLHDPGTASHSITITTVPADDWFPTDTRLDVVKLDIEGNEVEAVRGMQRLLRDAGPGITVFAECNPEMLKRAGQSPESLIAALQDCNLKVEWIDDVEGRVRAIDHEMLRRGYVNFRCTRA
jgi:FkbM family methyltransferase